MRKCVCCDPQRGLLELRDTAISASAPGSDLFHDSVIARASVGVAHIDLIEHVIQRLDIVHLAI